MPLPALAIAGLALGGAQAIGGLFQMGSAGRRRAEPKYQIPGEVFEATKRAEEMAREGMPEASRMQALQGAQQAALFRQRAAGQSRIGQANVATNETLLSRDLLNVAQTDAQVRLDNQRRALQALMTQAQYRDKAFGNQWQSWANREQQRQETRAAGMQNIVGGLTSAAGVLTMGLAGGGGQKTGFGYNSTSASLLRGGIPKIFNEPFTPSASSMSLFKGNAPFSGFSLLNSKID